MGSISLKISIAIMIVLFIFAKNVGIFLETFFKDLGLDKTFPFDLQYQIVKSPYFVLGFRFFLILGIINAILAILY